MQNELHLFTKWTEINTDVILFHSLLRKPKLDIECSNLESNLSQLKNSNLFFLFVIKHKQTIYSFQRLVKAFKTWAYSVENHLKHTQLTKRILLGFSNKQSIESTKQSIVLVWQQVNQPKQFWTFSKTPKSKTIDCFDKTTGCFSLSLKNTLILKDLKTL